MTNEIRRDNAPLARIYLPLKTETKNDERQGISLFIKTKVEIFRMFEEMAFTNQKESGKCKFAHLVA